jgi:Activator of Hsp90 ATPase homolog 1-like protein
MGQQMTEIAPVTKSVSVNRTPEEAFRIYTEGIATWWPLDTHSPSGKAETVVIEPREGGRLYERTTDGEEVEWGEILVWDPPRRLVHSWHLGRREATEVELRFSPEGEGTLVELIHRGWESHGEHAAAVRASYDSGWDYVFGERYGSALR